MRSMFLRVAVGAAFTLSTAFASAAVLSFDDIAGSNDYSPVPANYGGVDWSASTWAVLTSPQAPYTPHSGEGRITLSWGSSDADSSLQFQEPTVFDGAWFSGYSEVSVRFDLYSAGQLVASSSTLTLSATPVFLSSAWSGAIDKVVVSSPLHAFYVMDDLTFTPVSEVPEPATWALMFAGSACIVRAVRRKA